MSNFYRQLDIGSSYDFKLKATAILGVGFDSALVMGILDYNTARLIQDVTSLHNAALPNLGIGVASKASDQIYIKIKTLSGEERVIADSWLAQAPIAVNSQTLKITVNNASLNDIAVIRSMLLSKGFTDFYLETN